MTRTTPREVLFSPLEELSWRPLLQRWICSQCALGVHRQCSAYGCECACHDDPWLAHKPSRFTLRYGKRKQSSQKNQKPERTKTMRVIRYEPQRQFELPPEGVHRARLDEIKDLDPAINTKGEEKERIRFIWILLHLLTSNGGPMAVFQTFNVSLHPQSFLSAAIRDITGQEPGTQFDLDTLIGTEVDLVLRHNQGSDGTTYCNVATILRLKTRVEEAEEKRVRAITEEVKEQGRNPHAVKAAEPDVPF